MEKIDRNELFALLTEPETPQAAPAESPAEAPKPAMAEPIEASAGRINSPANPAVEGPSKAPPLTAEAAELHQAKTPNPPGERASYVSARSPSTWKSQSAHLHYLLSKSVPRMWTYALQHHPSLDVRQLRAKLRELLVWLFEKEGFKVTAKAQTPYQQGQRRIAGRIDLLVLTQSGLPLLALEADWTREEASIRKLEHWHQKGIEAVWLIGADGRRDTFSAWRRFAEELPPAGSRRWLKVLHLQHGWIS